jgi:multidrug resistance efflux pump
LQQATRTRLQEALRPLAKRIEQCRLDLAKLECPWDILRDDLAAGQQDWESTKDVIAKAARRAYTSNPRRNLIQAQQITGPPEDRPRRASEAASTDLESSRAGSVQQGLSHSTSVESLPPMKEGVELKVDEVLNSHYRPPASHEENGRDLVKTVAMESPPQFSTNGLSSRSGRLTKKRRSGTR